MKTGRDRVHLLHIRDAVEKILKYSTEITFDDFAKIDMHYDAVLMQIVVIGEGINDLSDEFKEKYNDVPWYEAVGLRNRIAHDYVEIKPAVIWDTVKRDMPKLKKQVEKILKNTNNI